MTGSPWSPGPTTARSGTRRGRKEIKGELRSASAAVDRAEEDPKEVVEASAIVTAGALGRGAHCNASLPHCAGESDGMAEACLSCGLGNIDEHAVVDRLGAAVGADDLRVCRVAVLLLVVHGGSPRCVSRVAAGSFARERAPGAPRDVSAAFPEGHPRAAGRPGKQG
jgi:hypothetical protein